MGQIHYEDRVSFYLNDENHGNHNLPHIHIKWSDGTNASYNLNGDLIVGSNRDERLMSNYLKKNAKSVFENYKLLKQGKKLIKIEEKVY